MLAAGLEWKVAPNPKPPLPSDSCLSTSLNSILEAKLEKLFPLCLWGFYPFIFNILPSLLKRKNNNHPIISFSMILSTLQIFQVPKHFASILFPLFSSPCVSFFHF